MSTAIRVQCDGADHTCPTGRYVPTATTTTQARAYATAHWRWTSIGDDDYCPTCTTTPRTRPTPPTMRTPPAVTVTDDPPPRCPHCDAGDHHTCTHHHCACTTTPTCGSTP